jgi:hypothetical protein
MAPLPDLVWKPREFHACLIRALDEAYQALEQRYSEFPKLWAAGRPLPGSKTGFRQAPMLGTGAQGRDQSGFVAFARAYCTAEGEPWDRERCSFERYADFILYTAGNWYRGEKVPLMVAEAETHSGELLGELSGLVSLRAPHKYLFMDPYNTLERLNDWAYQATSPCDWPSTTYHVIEIPRSPALPSTWTHFIATVQDPGSRLTFMPVPTT